MALHAQPVAAVKNDHHTTMRMRTRRGPMRSPIHPPGISNSAYAQANAENTQPICTFDRPRSRLIAGPASEIETRSRYWMIASSIAKATAT